MPISFSRRIFATVLAVILAAISATAGNEAVQLKTVVIDAGHGGHDSGAISLDGKLKEKNVVLDIALQLGSRIKKEYPGVKVIYTRDKDVFIPLDKRADIANKNHADLFISIHSNSVPKKAKAPSGCETWVMGMNKNAANMAVCKTENSVILLEDDYNTKYQGFDPNDTESYIFFNLMQNAYFEQSLIFADLCQKELHKGPIPTNRGIKQGGLLVLWRTTMPSVLVEVGFISNASDKATLASKEKRDQIAGNLFNAFKKFKEQYESGSESTLPEVTESEDDGQADDTPTEEAQPEQPKVDPSGEYFSVQVFAISKDLAPGAPQFKGEKDVRKFKSGGVFKYTIGTYETASEAAAAAERLKAKFPGCFVVKLDNFEIKKK